MTREELRDKLREYAEKFAAGFAISVLAIEDRILEEFDRLLKADKWRDAAKDPPKKDGGYVVSDGAQVWAAYFDAYLDEDEWPWSDGDGTEDDDVKYWMPFPPPPKGGE